MTFQSLGINPALVALHKAYCKARSIDVPMTDVRLRFYGYAHKGGVTPEMMTTVIRYWNDKNRLMPADMHEKNLTLSRLFGDSVLVDEFVEFGAGLMAKARVKHYDPNKAAVMRATGRSDEPETDPAKRMAVSLLIDALRKEANQ